MIRARSYRDIARRTVTIDLGDQSVDIRVRPHPNARRYTLRVPTRGDIPILTMPAGGSEREALIFLNRHIPWLRKRLEERPDRIAFEDGAVIPVRGQAHVIDHRPGRRGPVRVEQEAGEQVIWVAGEEPHLSRRITDWLRAEARRDLEPAVFEFCERLDTRAKSIRIGDPKTRWGSCSTTGRLSFSWRLIMAPPFVLRYLAAHEVSHFKEMNHSDRFWNLVQMLYPETDRAEAWLKNHGRRLHRYG